MPSITLVMPSTIFFLFSSVMPDQTLTCTTGNCVSPCYCTVPVYFMVSENENAERKIRKASLFLPNVRAG